MFEALEELIHVCPEKVFCSLCYAINDGRTSYRVEPHDCGDKGSNWDCELCTDYVKKTNALFVLRNPPMWILKVTTTFSFMGRDTPNTLEFKDLTGLLDDTRFKRCSDEEIDEHPMRGKLEEEFGKMSLYETKMVYPLGSISSTQLPTTNILNNDIRLFPSQEYSSVAQVIFGVGQCSQIYLLSTTTHPEIALTDLKNYGDYVFLESAAQKNKPEFFAAPVVEAFIEVRNIFSHMIVYPRFCYAAFDIMLSKLNSVMTLVKVDSTVLDVYTNMKVYMLPLGTTAEGNIFMNQDGGHVTEHAALTFVIRILLLLCYIEHFLLQQLKIVGYNPKTKDEEASYLSKVILYLMSWKNDLTKLPPHFSNHPQFQALFHDPNPLLTRLRLFRNRFLHRLILFLVPVSAAQYMYNDLAFLVAEVTLVPIPTDISGLRLFCNTYSTGLTKKIARTMYHYCNKNPSK